MLIDLNLLDGLHYQIGLVDYDSGLAGVESASLCPDGSRAVNRRRDGEGGYAVGTGQLAYIQAGLKFLKEVKTAHYKATVDGEIIEVEAVICYILNAGSIGGVMGMEIPKIGDVSISDGYLDLYAITKGVQPLRAVSKYIFHHEGSDAGVYHWRGKEITFEADPVQDVWIDGELDGKTPFKVKALPQALEIVVPA